MSDVDMINDFIPVSRPHFWGEEKANVREAIDSGWISSSGQYIERFEADFAAFVGVRHAIAVCNGTCALQLAIAALEIGEGDEVIVPDFSMMAPIFAVMHAGAKPVPVDADDSWNLDADKVDSLITPRTRAILAVHTYGHPANMKCLLDIAARRGVHVIEDAAEAHGATVDGMKVGSMGAIGTFSFYANKIVTTGEGGMVVTNDDNIARQLTSMRNMSFGDTVESRFAHKGLGFNFRMSNLHAAIGVGQMEHIHDAISERARIGNEYRHALYKIDGITLPPQLSWADPVNWVFGIVVESKFGMSRAALQDYLRSKGIDTRRFFTPLHEQSFFSSDSKHEFPMATRLGSNGLYLPTFVDLEPHEIARICEAIESARQAASSTI